MKSILSKLFKTPDSNVSGSDIEHLLRVSTAALLIEVSRADFEQQSAEVGRMRELLADQFELSNDDLDELMREAHDKADDLVSLQHITRLLNEQFDQDMKARVIEMMWQVIYADGVKDRYEEHMIRQVAELLYVPHSTFIQARHKAESGNDSQN